MNLDTLQSDVKEWSSRNFPNNQPYHPLLGALEELGELAHAHLKEEQGIRGSALSHHMAKVDAVGDVIIYLTDYCWRNGINISDAVTLTWHEVSKRDWIKNTETG